MSTQSTSATAIRIMRTPTGKCRVEVPSLALSVLREFSTIRLHGDAAVILAPDGGSVSFARRQVRPNADKMASRLIARVARFILPYVQSGNLVVSLDEWTEWLADYAGKGPLDSAAASLADWHKAA